MAAARPTAKDFDAIGVIFTLEMARADQMTGEEALLSLAGRLADYFATRNQGFDRAKFLDGCDMTEVEVEQ